MRVDRDVGASGQAQAQQRTAAFAKGPYFRTLEVDLPVEHHEQLDGDDPRIMGEDQLAIPDQLVSEVFDGMTEGFESAAGGRVDAAAAVGANRRRLNGSKQFR